MRTFRLKRLVLVGVLAALSLGGCGRKAGPTDEMLKLIPVEELGQIVGSVARVPTPAPMPVQGVGLIAGLPGTGSSHCPVAVREYLKRYVASQLGGRNLDVDQLIQSRNTAVVQLDAVISPAPSEGQRLDVRASLIPGSDATSLQGGWLYPAELKPRGMVGAQGQLAATAEGPVFVNVIDTSSPDPTAGYVLGGGRTAYNYRAVLKLRRANFTRANQVRNRLNEVYGPGTAAAPSPTNIALRIPPKYRWRKERFMKMVAVTFLEQTPELTRARVDTFVRQLAVAEEKATAELALEAIGRASAPKLAALLQVSDQEARLRAARCLLSLGDDRGLIALRQIALDKNSPYRREALDAVAVLARRSDAMTLAQRMLRAADGRLVLAAYEHLRRIQAPAIVQEFVGRYFYLEQVVQTDHKAVFVSRSGEPRVVIFGGPLRCRDNLFAESPDGSVVIDSPAGRDYATLTRSHPFRPRVIGPVKADLELRDIVRALGTDPVAAQDGGPPGLGVCYADVTAMVQQLVAKEAVTAEFWLGPMPKFDPIVKK